MKRLTVLLAASLLLVACSKEEPPPEPVRPVLSMEVKAEDQENLGRFAGTIQVYVPRTRFEEYCTAMEGIFGSGCVIELHVGRPGVCALLPDGRLLEAGK